MRETFSQKAKRVADEVSIDVDFFQDNKYQLPFIDDGTLHILNRTGLRACFDVSNHQELKPKKQDKPTRRVMVAMGLESQITNRVLECEERPK